MAFETYDQLRAYLRESTDHESAFGRIAALTSFYRDTILPPRYRYPEATLDGVVLTEAGIQAESWLLDHGEDWRPADVRAAVFATLAHREPFVDILASDCDLLRDAISEEIRSRRIRYPFVFYRELYDRFFEMFGTDLSSLSVEETARLLEGTPQGVCQIGNLVSGDYGLVESVDLRHIPPITSPPLTHCRDRSCESVHGVDLMTGSTDAGEAYRALRNHLLTSVGAAAPWKALVSEALRPRSRFNADFNPADLPWLIGNCLSDAELRLLLAGVIETSNDVRTQLAAIDDGASRKSGPEIALPLDRARLLQLLLVASDVTIADVLDRLVLDGQIVIPPAEVRIAPYHSTQISVGVYRQVAQLSQLGVRFVPQNRGWATARLKALIERSHSSDQLAWNLMSVEGRSVDEKLERLVHDSDLNEIINQFALRTRDLYESATDYVRYGHFSAPSSDDARALMSERLLWKLGFDVQLFPPLQKTFWRRLDTLKSVVESGPINTEEREETLRAAAVNAFVSLEDILDEALAFSTWALLFDHYGVRRRERFHFNLAVARRWTAEQLGGRAIGRGETLSLRPTGRNNLYALVTGFRVLSQLCRETLEKADEPSLLRAKEDLPPWLGLTSLREFPLIHTSPVLDLEEEASSELVDLFVKVHNVLMSADVLAMRNRIPHGGGRIPDEGQIRLALTAIDEAVGLLEEAGAAPLVFQPIASSSDGFGRCRTTLQDYAGREVVLFEPSELVACDVPAPGLRQIVLSQARVRGTAEVLRFRFDVDSEFREMWANYPCRAEAPDEDVATVLGLDVAL